MVAGYSAQSASGIPYVVIGEDLPTILIIPGTEPEPIVPNGLRLQGVRGAFEELADHGTVCVAWRRRIESRQTSIDDLCDAYEGLVRELELADLTVVGISTGSLIAIELAARMRARCRHLVLIAGGAAVSDRGKQILAKAESLAQEGAWRELALIQMRSFYPGVAGRLFGAIGWLFPALYGTPDDPTHFVSLCRIAREADLHGRIPDLSTPLLCIGGENDPYFPPDDLRKIALLCHDGESVVIPRAGHGVFKSHANEINKRVRAFMESSRKL